MLLHCRQLQQRFYTTEKVNRLEFEVCLLTNRYTVLGLDKQHLVNNVLQLLGVLPRNLSVFTLDHFLVQSPHIFGLKWQLEAGHFIGDAPHGPNITLKVIRLIPPHFRRCIVWCSGLRVVQSILPGQFRHVQVSYFDYVIVR